MKLTISEPGKTPGPEDTYKGDLLKLVQVVKVDLRQRGATEEEIRKVILHLGKPMYGIHGANYTDDTGYMIAGYRITK